MTLIADSFSSKSRPVLQGVLGAVSAAHPLAVAAGQEILTDGGTAVDAAIAAQAVLAVVAPGACGLGGDALCLVHRPGEAPVAVNGAGAAPAGLVPGPVDGATSIAVPGLVHAWAEMQRRWGALPLSRLLQPAVRVARRGFPMPLRLARSVEGQRARLLKGGAESWQLLHTQPNAILVQNEIATVLDRIGKEGAKGFYEGETADAIVRAVRGLGGSLSATDLEAHTTVVRDPVTVDWEGARVSVQPPMTQGVLLAMVLKALEKLGRLPADLLDHAEVELTEAAFGFRDRSGEGEALLAEPLDIDLTRASLRGGPRAYLHTAGVAVADRFGTVVSSLVSVFDDFGSAVYVPEGGFVLNDRAAGFTNPPNEAAPGKRPVHTLAPALVSRDGATLALSTPGADGQVQTLLQVLARVFVGGEDLASAIDAPRWRSEGGALLIEPSHPALERLKGLGHRVKALTDGDLRFGGVVCAGFVDGAPVATADWRRQNWAGVA